MQSPLRILTINMDSDSFAGFFGSLSFGEDEENGDEKLSIIFGEIDGESSCFGRDLPGCLLLL